MASIENEKDRPTKTPAPSSPKPADPDPSEKSDPASGDRSDLITEQLKFETEKELAQQRLDHGGVSAYRERMSKRDKKPVPSAKDEPPAPESIPTPTGARSRPTDAPEDKDEARDRPSLARVLTNRDRTGW